ncbi:MAG: transglycosylase domain-containing protein [Lewinellaceae bacterium]|nr:transglycosylase domain-containing protein [Lewinellaceae bacterium]
MLRERLQEWAQRARPYITAADQAISRRLSAWTGRPIVSVEAIIREKAAYYWAKRPNRQEWLRYGLWGMAGGGVLLVLFVISVYLGLFGALPNYQALRDIRNNNAAEVYGADGVLLGRYFTENRVNADFEEISPNIINALVATEDARFFEHGGVDPRALLRVMVKSILLSDESSGGGSTLSQQLAKNLFPRRSYWMFSTPVNKVREMFVARRLEQIYTKEELLRLYLNTVPFSDNIFGVKVAAQRFFGQSLAELKVEEAAVLVGMLKAPTSYHPVRHPERALERRNTVLAQMKRYKYLTEAGCDSLQQLPINLHYSQDGRNQGPATYFREHLRVELEDILEDYRKPDGSRYDLYTDGLRIYTTIDSRLQRYAEAAVQEQMPQIQANFAKEWKKGTPWGSESILQQAVKQTRRYKQLKEAGASEKAIERAFNEPHEMTLFTWGKEPLVKEMTPLDSVKYYLAMLNTGMLAMDPATGEVKVWVGGIDHGYIQFDHVKARRQVGSTFKPVVYAAALEAGISPCEYFPNELVEYPEYENWKPENSDGEYGGIYSMEGALSKSINTVSVAILMRTGIEPVRKLGRDMGVSAPIPNAPSIALGTTDASLYDMVQVFGTLANRGVRVTPHYLVRIEDSEGNEIVSFKRPASSRALSEVTSNMVLHMLEGVVNNGTGRRLRTTFGLRGPIAGKTGTSQNNADGWFIGCTPGLVAGVWVGASTPAVHFRSLSSGQGSSTALPIWGSFMRRASAAKSLRKYYGGSFPAVPDSLQWAMDCPPNLDDLPIASENWLNFMTNPAFYSRLYQEMQQRGDSSALARPVSEQVNDDLELRFQPRRANESDSAYYNRMLRFNSRALEREDRREERKEFWNKLLFGNKKKNNDGGQQ